MRIRYALVLVALLIAIAASGCAPSAAPAGPLPTTAPPMAAPFATANIPPTPIFTSLPTSTLTPAPDYEAEVRAVTDQYNEAIRNMDVEAYAAFFMPDGLLQRGTEPWPTRYREVIREDTKAYWGVQFRVDKYEWTIDSIEIDIPMATVHLSYTLDATALLEQRHGHNKGKDIIIWIRQPDGTWLIQMDYEIGPT